MITLSYLFGVCILEETRTIDFFDRTFHLSENNTNIKQECLAGLTTFVSMAYILFVNPSVLGVAGMDKGAVFTATALSAIIGCHLQAALVRIENKTYGICRETGKLIPKERLRAVPHATLGIDIKNQQNRK